MLLIDAPCIKQHHDQLPASRPKSVLHAVLLLHQLAASGCNSITSLQALPLPILQIGLQCLNHQQSSAIFSDIFVFLCASAGVKLPSHLLRYSDLLRSCQAVLENMLALHSALAQQHPAAAAAASQALQQRQQEQHEQQAGSAGGSKRRRSQGIGLLATGALQGNEQAAEAAASTGYGGLCSDASSAWAAVSGAISSLAGFRDASLDKWHRRTVLSSSTAALRGSGGLRALQQSISSQVRTKADQLHTS